MRTQLADMAPGDRMMAEAMMAGANLLGRLDYQFFVNEILGYTKIEEFHEIHDPRVQWHLEQRTRDINDWFATRSTQRTYRKILDFRPRGSCKSSVFSVPLGPQAHLRDEDISVGLMSCQYEDMAVKFTTAVKQSWQGESESSLLTDLYGDFTGRGEGRVWNTDQMVTSKRKSLERTDPTLKAFSVRKGATSGHYDLFILDDLITDEAMENDQRWLERTISAYLRMPFVLNADGLLYVIGTRYHHGDLCGFIIENEIKPAARDADLPGAPPGRLPDDFAVGQGWIKYAHLAGWTVYYDEVYTDFGLPTQRPTYPVIWPEERIAQVRNKGPESERFFWYQLMNRPQDRADAPVKRHHVERVWFDKYEHVPAQATVEADILCDFAFKRLDNYKRAKGDRSCAFIKLQHVGHVYIPFGMSGRMSQDDFGRQLIQMCVQAKKVYNISRFRFITYDLITGHGAGDDSMGKWLESLFLGVNGLNLPMAKPLARKRMKGAKEQKLLGTAWAWQDGYIHIKRDIEGAERAAEKMLFLDTTDVGDDEADAISDAFHEDLYHQAPGRERKRLSIFQTVLTPSVPGEVDKHGRFRVTGTLGKAMTRRKEARTKWR